MGKSSFIDVNSGYKVLFINLEITDFDISRIKLKTLPTNWKSLKEILFCKN